MEVVAAPDRKRKQFVWGVVLAWVPFLFLAVPTAVGLYRALRGISQEKATGLAAVGGGLIEFFVTFGLATTVVFELVAVVLLLRTIHGGRAARTLLSAFSLCCSAVMLTVAGVFVWFVTRAQ